MNKIYFILFIAFLGALHAYGQAGFLDASFGTSGIVNTSFGTQFTDEIHDIAIQSDGKIVVVGMTNDPGIGLDKISLARYNPSGALDLSFGTNGLVTTTAIANFNCKAVAVAIQTDGKILVGGQANDTATTLIQNGYFLFLRYTTTGILDNTFGVNGIKSIQSTSTYSTEVTATDMLLQPDGNIVLSGSTYYSASSEFIFMRVDSNGSLDNTFATSGVAIISSTIGEAIPNAIAIQADGKIVYSGYIDASTTNYPMVGRLTSNGTADASFGNSGHALPTFTGSAGFYGVTLESGSGNIVACGFGNDGALIQRFLPTGITDAGFGTSGYFISEIGTQQDAMLYDISVQNDGKIVAGGVADAAFALIRTTNQGSIDIGFGVNGITQTSLTTGIYAEAHAIKIQGDGKIVLGGTNLTANATAVSMYALTRYNNDVTTSLSNYSNNKTVSFYPNPTSDLLTFQWSGNQDKLTIEVYNVSGKLILKDKITSFHSQLNVSELPNGLYTVSITDNVYTYQGKLVVAH